ncbi:hypothetical protein Klosneuvirus_1_17 [Klosneuvirus KNV1]|uniref:Uncharacterized protein n=1 Tax=Klosneuvirus KNV1 TaxID=1977640 RepID=A0A1V0SHF9_9VIRU|nr:hypothetical protein Klosneuvirus_1_17 [Klosneuvirus KNV1]
MANQIETILNNIEIIHKRNAFFNKPMNGFKVELMQFDINADDFKLNPESLLYKFLQKVMDSIDKKYPNIFERLPLSIKIPSTFNNHINNYLITHPETYKKDKLELFYYCNKQIISFNTLKTQNGIKRCENFVICLSFVYLSSFSLLETGNKHILELSIIQLNNKYRTDPNYTMQINKDGKMEYIIKDRIIIDIINDIIKPILETYK